jgi:signal transduction histidine kinase
LILSLFLYKLLTLNRRLRANNRIIEKQREELASLNATKDKFFSIVAHDIRSPLDALKSFTTLLLEHYETMTRDEVQQMGAHLDRSVDNTLQLANNLIIWAKGQMNEIATEQSEFELRPVLENVHSVFEAIARQKHIDLEISCSEDTVVWGDRNQIEFVIRNLVNNAIKYTRKEGRVQVRVQNAAENKIQITISDNGVGMEQEIVDQLFTIRTEKSRKGTAGEIGSGLGLALSHDFVKLNKGSIQVESQPDQGTSFTLILKEPRTAA